ncbi:MAG: Ig-like domain-containing protein, partial [Candidatus Riflebacteria bacterium]|nr:Ig-like domain-containing protein [Candidatus Riflebacteria bacterium]
MTRRTIFPYRLILCALVGVAALLGCMGGGGGGGGTGTGSVVSSEDQALMTAQIQTFLAAITRGNSQVLNQVFSQRLQTLAGTGEGVETFTVWDFGTDIHQLGDDATFTFFVEPTQIRYLADNQASVPTWTQFANGAKIRLEFLFIRENGVWLIDSLQVEVLDSGSIGLGGFMTSVDLVPLEKGNIWRYVTITASPSSTGFPEGTAEFRMLRIDREPSSIDGVSLFRLRTTINRAVPTFAPTAFGVPTAGLMFGRRPGGGDAFDDAFFPKASASSAMELWDILDAKRAGEIRLANFLGLFAYGADGSFNGDRPWRMTGLVVKGDSQTSQTVTFEDGSQTRTAELRARFMGNTTFVLPSRAVTPLRLDVSARLSDSGEIGYFSLFFEPGLGIAAVVHYREDTRQPERQEYFVEGRVGGAAIGIPGTTANFAVLTVANLACGSSLVCDQPFAHSFVASGGAAPYQWSLIGAPAWLLIDASKGTVSGTPPQPGICSFTLCVRDSANLSAACPVVWEVGGAIDVVPPRVAWSLPADGASGVLLNEPIRIQFTEPMATASLSPPMIQVFDQLQAIVPGTIVVNGSSAVLVPASPWQERTIYTVKTSSAAADLAGNPMGSPYQFSFTTTFTLDIDTTPPVAALFATPANPTNLTTTDITVGGTDVTAYRYALDGGTFSAETPVSTHIALSALTDGAHTIGVIGRDTLGNWQSTPTTFAWTIDTAAPAAVLSTTPANPTNLTTADITVAGTDVTAYKYSVDGGAYSAETPVSTHIALSALTDGAHTLGVIGRDALGNWQSTPTTFAWTID